MDWQAGGVKDSLTKRFLLDIVYVRKSSQQGQQGKKYPTSTIQTYGITLILTSLAP